jgi:hypothetical protein
MKDKRCKCSMSISLVGDGCRYCQPQEYIDLLESTMDAMNVVIERFEVDVDEAKTTISNLEGEVEFMMSIRNGGT